MIGKLRAFTIAAILAAASFARPARAQIDVHIGIPSPPLPHIVFETEPQVIVIPNTDVYYAPSVGEYDTYRVGPYWYINHDGYWYRARGYREQFLPVPYSRVPRQITVVPGEYRHHRMRPERLDVGGRPDGHPNGHHHTQHGDSRHQDKHHQHD